MLDILPARPYIITLSTVDYSVWIYYSFNLRSGIYFFPFYSITVFCTLSRLFVRFGLYSGIRLLCVRFEAHAFVWTGSENKVRRNMVPSTLRVPGYCYLVKYIDLAFLCLGDADREQGVLQWQPPVHRQSSLHHSSVTEAFMSFVFLVNVSVLHSQCRHFFITLPWIITQELY